MDEQSKPRGLWPFLVVLIGVAWLVWLAIYLFINVYVPGWQHEQAASIENALHRDCGITFSVPPASVPLTTRPIWERTYTTTGYKLVCQTSYTTGEWRCTACGSGP